MSLPVTDVNALTGVITKRDYTKDELSAIKAAEEAAQQAANDAAIAAQNAANAIAHAKSLGFTDQMISAMYPALTAVAS